MESRLFCALQCVQCATMQVKQQKKSSNKWVCVVCNQRQSVLRVHARGYRAADLRRFVQDANLARGRREFAPLAEPDVGSVMVAVEEQRDVFPIEKRQTEWSEYLDDPWEPDTGCGGLGADASDGGEGIEVITELPQKRHKVRPLKAQSDVVGKRAKRQQIQQGSSPRSATTTAEVQRDTGLFGERKRSHITEATTDVLVEDEVLFKGTHWLRQWARLQRLEDLKNQLTLLGEYLETSALHFFNSNGWLSVRYIGHV